MPGIYLRHGDTYVEMSEAQFDAESILQRLIAQHPEILADESTGQKRLLLVRREASIADADEAGGRWSLDHLYVDSEGVPTLVEVKRSSDTRGRREVVAQMLDYAANVRFSFTAELMASWVDEHARARGTTGPEATTESLGIEDVDGFWATVASNLEAERFRLIFVSDKISRELRRIIEFLNGQMSQTDVVAIEVKQYVDESGAHQTIVPRVIGDTETSRREKRKRGRPRRITHSDLLAELSASDNRLTGAADALLEWANSDPRLDVRWTRAGDIWHTASDETLLRLWAEGTVELKVAALRRFEGQWDDVAIEKLLQELETIDGVAFSGSRRSWPRTPLLPLADTASRGAFIAVLERVLDGLPGAQASP